ncbi:MAG: insulinase family protein [Spirochaetota bacterium]
MGELLVGGTLHGFTLVSKTKLPEQNAIGLRFTHDATGLELYHVANKDPENMFAFMFKTPPKNNYGTPHIIEHAVLSGSRKYPSKEPFLSLMKGSANTFLNAMTYPDKTVYPAASPIRKDYFNMMSVYADAVFFPLLRRETFKQEGFRLCVDEKNHLSYDGIVFNEMKGAYSDHDSIVEEHSVRTLFPDSPYGFDSGGNPEEIPNLTFEEFTGYHAEFYHPSNCRIFLYGNIATEKQLEFIETNYLKEFSLVKFSHEVGEPKQWDRPKQFEFTSPLSEGELPAKKSTITLNWWACNITNPLDVLTLEVLTEALLGNPGAPLYKAIIESGYGADIAPISGMDSDFKQVVFSLGITGTDPEHRDSFEQLMLKELGNLVKEGIPEEIVRQAIQRIEFQQREIRGGIPNGLRVFSRSARGWLHGLAPEDTLVFSPTMERLKELVGEVRIQNQPSGGKKKTTQGYLENWIERHLITNMHRALVVVRPEAEHIAKIEKRLAQQLAKREQQLTKNGLRQLHDEQRRYADFQSSEDSPEILERIPTLSRQDLPKEISKLNIEHKELESAVFLRQQLFTNGITYVELAVDINGLSEWQQQLMPLFTRLIYMTSLPGMSYDELSRKLAELTGGFSIRLEAGTSEPRRFMIIRMKALSEQISPAVEFMKRILVEAEFSNLRRLKDVVQELKSNYVSHIIPGGSMYASLRAASHLSPAAAEEELWKGVSQWFFLKGIEVDNQKSLKQIAEELERIRSSILVQSRLTVQVTGEQAGIEAAVSSLQGLVQTIPAQAAPTGESASSAEHIEHEPLDSYEEAFILPSQVGFTAFSCRAEPFGTTEQVAQSVLLHVLKTSFLWDWIRMQGGAYGAGADIDSVEEYITFSSYRDPRLAETFSDYQRAVEQAAAGKITSQQTELSIISLVGRDARPLSPGEKSYLGLKRYLFSITDKMREERRTHLLQITRDATAEAANGLLQLMKGERSRVVLCSSGMLERDREKLPGCYEHSVKLPL